jgi:hypothetical protein
MRPKLIKDSWKNIEYTDGSPLKKFGDFERKRSLSKYSKKN